MTEDQKRLEEIKGRLATRHKGDGETSCLRCGADEWRINGYCSCNCEVEDELDDDAVALLETVEAQAAEVERLRAENDDFYRSDIALTRSISMFKAEVERLRGALRDIGHAEGRGKEPSVFNFREIARAALEGK